MDRREYSRINVGAEGAFFLRDNGSLICEFTGTIENVCEGGIHVLIDTREYEKVNSMLEEGHSISFHAFDDQGYSIKEEEGIFFGCVEIVRKELSENMLSLGCKLEGHNLEFQEYVKDKRVYLFMKSIRVD